jgi:predicted phosphate transport protein (TIGR00153 family)
MSIFSRRPLAEFYDLFEEAAANAARSAELLHEMLGDYPDDGGHAREILLCEQTGDRITHSILRLLGEGARPPLPRTSAHRLATDIDDVVDFIEQVSDCFALYKIEAPMDPSLELASVLVEATKALVVAVGTMRSGASLKESIIRVHQLENEGDKLSREAIASLFAGGVDPMVVIRWKDIFEQMEHAIDACEHVAHTLEGGSYGG